MTESAVPRALLVDAFRMQARGCEQTGSPIYAELLGRAADDLERGGLFAGLVDGYRGHPILDALPLRLLGELHFLVLTGEAPALARHYPSAGGCFEAEGAWRALCDVAMERREALRAAASGLRVQTNEVRRSAALLGGFLRIARETGMPLRLREIGSSAGLNLLWDRYRYALGPHRWGDPQAEVLLETEWSGPAPDVAMRVRVASRAGCDVSPIDVRDPAQAVRLESFVWPEQLDRLAQLRAAAEVARTARPRIDAARAGDWVSAELAAPIPGEVTVLFHSVMWWYLPEAERDRVSLEACAAGTRASASAPFAWLRMEPVSADALQVRLTLWPGGDDRLLADVHPHGRFVRWEG